MKTKVRQRYHNLTNSQLIFSGVVGLLLSYGIATRALETGSYWQYLACFVFLFLGLKLLTKSFKK